MIGSFATVMPDGPQRRLPERLGELIEAIAHEHAESATRTSALCRVEAHWLRPLDGIEAAQMVIVLHSCGITATFSERRGQ